MKKQWFVYIITNYKNTVLYAGKTSRLKRRIREHKKGYADNSFSKKYRLYKLVWFEEFDSSQDAIRVERKIKGWRREKKLDLIKSKNFKFEDLYARLAR